MYFISVISNFFKKHFKKTLNVLKTLCLHDKVQKLKMYFIFLYKMAGLFNF